MTEPAIEIQTGRTNQSGTIDRTISEQQATTSVNVVDSLEFENVSLCKRLKLLFKPIYAINTVGKSTGDSKTHIVLVPEAFRMCFYFGFILFLLIGFVVSTLFGNLDYHNNPIKSRFGTNNMCIYFDEKPFIYFSTVLWIILLQLLYIYLFMEWYRVHDCYRDDKMMAKSTYYIYNICTVYEVIAYTWHSQAFAVRPNDNIIVHTLPYFGFLLALWATAFKHSIYFADIRIFPNKNIQKLSFVYTAALLATVIGKLWVGFPNLFGFKLWQQNGYEWTPLYSDINDYVFLFLTIPCPVIMYLFVIQKLDKINILLNRDRIRSSAVVEK